MSNSKQGYLQGLEEERDALYKQLSRTLDEADKLRLKRRIAELEQEIQQLTSEPGQRTPFSPTPQSSTLDQLLSEYARLKATLRPEQPNHFLIKLRNIIGATFNDGELRELCEEVGADYQNLPGSGKADKARELVAWCERRSRTPDLIKAVYRLRPEAAW